MTIGVVLVAGKSLRMHPLTVSRPKPLLKIANKPLLDYTLDILCQIVSEIVLVVGFEAEQFLKHYGSSHKGIPIRYVHQNLQKGTGHALLCAKSAIKSNFIVLMGDDLYAKDDLIELVSRENQILAGKSVNMKNFGMIAIQGKNQLLEIVEKPLTFISDAANTGAYHLSCDIFSILEKTKPIENGEIYLTDAINVYSKTYPIQIVKATKWIPVGYPWDLLLANANILENFPFEMNGLVEENVKIKGNVGIGKNSIIKSGTYIEGPVLIGENCVIGPNAYLRGSTTIGNNCKIGASVEIKNSVIMDETHIAHLSYVGDSIIGCHVNFGAGTIIANLRHDLDFIKTRVGADLISTGIKKFGAVIGDKVKTGINTSIYPGRKIWPSKTTMPGELVKKDIL